MPSPQPPHRSPQPTRTGAPPRVLWLINGEEVGGVRTAAVNLLNAARDAGWTVAALALAGGELADAFRDDGVTVYGLEMGVPPGLGGSIGSRVRAVPALGRIAREAGRRAPAVVEPGSFDVVHFQWPNHLPIAGAIAKAIGAKVTWEMPNALGRSFSTLPSKLLYGYWCRKTGATALANSAYTAGTLASPLATARVFHLGVDPARFDPDALGDVSRDEVRAEPGDAVAIIAARVVKTKGQEQTVRALRKAIDREPGLMDPFRLAILGGPLDSPDGESLRAAIDECGLQDRVRLLGFSDRPERAIAASDIMINSRVDAEPFGLSIIEAMMLGKPTLVHAFGGPAETVLDGGTGWHITAPTVSAYADGLIRAMRDRARWTEMGAAARERALDRFTVEAQLARYRAALDEILPGR